MSIVVIGSINTDLTIQVPHFAAANETVLGRGDFATTQGGKGANQAIAAAAGGLQVHMLGKVGDDAFGEAAIEELLAAGVQCDRVTREQSHSTGVAAIFVDPAGNNSITVAPGANACVSADDIRAASDLIAAASIVMLQLEIPTEAVTEAIRIGNKHGTRIMLDPAPATETLPDLSGISFLTPNEVEAEFLTGIQPSSREAAEQIGAHFKQLGVSNVVLTLGENGCYVAGSDAAVMVETNKVRVVDSTGAGDAFNGFLATGLARGLGFVDAARIACEVASLSVTRAGARSKLPAWEEAQSLKGRYGKETD